MKFFEEKTSANGKIETQETAPPPKPAPTSGSSWVDKVYGVNPKKALPFERGDAMSVTDL